MTTQNNIQQQMFKIIHHRYKIHPDFELETFNLNGIALSKHSWYKSLKQMDSFASYIRSPQNLGNKGVLIYQTFNPANDKVEFTEIYYDSSLYLTNKPSIYSRHQLGIMERPQLIEVFRYYGGDSSNKDEGALIKAIIKAQNQRLKDEKQELTEV